MPTSDDFAGPIDIGGRRIWLECRGSGGPPVVLESGYPYRADVWDTVALGGPFSMREKGDAVTLLL